ncbi:MAG: hypothetical protein HZC40_05690 [Chloroflexi bacterium]|nr:hypothetical protein [Chloroflexota bacterium]
MRENSRITHHGSVDFIGNNVARLFQAAGCGLESPRHVNSFISDKV